MRSLVVEVLETALIGIAVLLLLQAALQNYRVQGQSMTPTLANDERLLVNKLSYATYPWAGGGALAAERSAADDGAFVFGPPQRGDVVVFHLEGRHGADLVKRVVGLPGETVALRGGRVTIDGRLLDEPYLATFDDDTTQAVTVPPGHVFVLGDNRGSSYDSRWMGPVPYDRIIGEALGSYWPPSRVGLLDGDAPAPP